jgi:hypothetical protein
LKYGPFRSQFYLSMKSMYRNVIKTLNNLGDSSLIEKFRPRLKVLVTKTEGIEGYHEAFSHMYEELEEYREKE